MQISSLYALRPLNVGQIIDRAVRLYRNAFWSCVFIALIVEIPLLVSRLFWRPPAIETFTDSSMAEVFGYGFLRLVVVMGVRLMTVAALSQVVVMAYEGRKVSVAAAYWRVLSRWWEILLTSLTLIPVTVLMIAWYFIPCLGSLSGVGLNAFYFTVIVPLCVPIVMLERQKGLAVLRRAWELTRSQFWASIGFVLFVILFFVSVWLGPRLFVQIVIVSLFNGDNLLFSDFSLPGFSGYLSFSDLVDTIFVTLIWPILMIALNLWYLDLRVRREGLDLFFWADAQLPDNLRLTPEKVLVKSPPRTGETWLNSTELARFIGLTILTVGLPIALAYGLVIIVELME